LTKLWDLAREVSEKERVSDESSSLGSLLIDVSNQLAGVVGREKVLLRELQESKNALESAKADSEKFQKMSGGNTKS
jgi:hypothetical protein